MQTITHIGRALLMNQLFVLQQQFHSLHELGVDRLQQSVLRLHTHNHQQLHHLQVLAIDGNRQ